MTRDNKRLAAAFYLSRDGDGRATAELACAAGFDEARGRWAGLDGCRLRVEVLSPDHRLVFIDFWASSFLERLGDDPVTVERDGAYAIARAFADACRALRAPAAFVLTHRDQANPRFVATLEWMVLALDGDALLSEGLGLTWMGSEFSLHPRSVDGRDEIPVEGGRLVFADRQEARWF